MAQVLELNLTSVRNPKKKEVALYFKELLSKFPALSIGQALLSAVEAEQISPETFSIYLPCAKSVDCVASCLRQDFSKKTRKIGIRHYGKVLTDPTQWQSAWKAMGGTAGNMEFMSSVSVRDLKFLISMIGSCNRGEARSQQREQAIQELFESLYSPQNSTRQGVDTRPVQNYYLQLLPACSTAFVRDWLEAGDKTGSKDVSLKRLLKSHNTMMQHLTETILYNSEVKKGNESWFETAFEEFAFREPRGKGDEPKFSASMSYSLRVMQWRLKHPEDKSWPNGVPDLSILSSLFERCQNKRVSRKRLHDIVALGLDLLKLPDHSKSHPVFKKIWLFLAKAWRKNPEQWQDVLILALQLGLGGSEGSLGPEFVRFPELASVSKTRRWELFQLYTLHVPKTSVDVSIMGNVKQLKRQQWPREVFDQFETKISAELLKEFISANLGYCFLPAPLGNTILQTQKAAGQANFNALLLLWSLQSSSNEKDLREESKQATEAATAEFQKRSAASREQDERAQYAVAALFVAIGSGSLDLYAKTVTWVGRFVRDPLTVKTLFHSRTVEAKEAVDLLTGIPVPPLSTDIDLAEVSAKVAKANAILQIFHKHVQTAKREPSFHKPDWQSIHSLFGKVIDTRVTLAKSLQAKLRATDGDMYSAVWSQSFAVLSEVGGDSLGRAQSRVASLIRTLSPQVLLTTTRALLDTDDMYRARAKEGDAGDESRIIGRLAYNGLIDLAKGDKPKLAQQLIIHTIINRPDASSWHRQLLTLGYLKTLPAKDAEGMLLAFANAIGEKLQEQSYVRVGEAPGAPSVVKVSTVKYLAQLLENAEFISADATVDVLVELFKSATHPDIRIATFESLMSSLLNKASSSSRFDAKTQKAQDPLMEKILVALESIIPVVGSINERRPPTQQDWEEAETDPNKLPGVHQDLLKPHSKPPLLHSVLEAAASRMSTPALWDLRRAFLNRILIPIVERAAAEHDKWTQLFLRKHGSDLADDNVSPRLPSIPLTPALSQRMVQVFPRLLPYSEITRLDDYTKFLLAQSPSLINLNQRLKKDSSKRSQPDVQHWLRVFDLTISQLLHDSTHLFIALLRNVPEGPDDACDLEPKQCREIVLSHMAILLTNYDHHIASWNALIDGLSPPHLSEQAATLLRWHRECGLLLQSVASRVNTARSKSWLENPKRKPAILPRASQIHLWLKMAPYLQRDPTDNEVDDCETLADEILDWIRMQSTAGGVRPERLASEIATLEPCLSHLEQAIIGCHIAEASGETETPALTENEVLTQVEAARHFIEAGWKAVDPDGEGSDGKKKAKYSAWVDRIRKARQIWLLSEFESVREIAVEIRGGDGKGNIWR